MNWTEYFTHIPPTNHTFSKCMKYYHLWYIRIGTTACISCTAPSRYRMYLHCMKNHKQFRNIRPQLLPSNIPFFVFSTPNTSERESLTTSAKSYVVKVFAGLLVIQLVWFERIYIFKKPLTSTSIICRLCMHRGVNESRTIWFPSALLTTSTFAYDLVIQSKPYWWFNRVNEMIEKFL